MKDMICRIFSLKSPGEKSGILAVPGTAFGEGGEKCIRLSFAASKYALEEAVWRLRELFA